MAFHKMSITCIIPTWNSAQVIGQCIDSVRAQSTPASEIVVVDNGSADHTREILGTYSEVHLVSLQRNMGFAAAVNVGVRAASCDAVLILNADVVLADDFLQEISLHFDRNPNDSMLATKLYLFSTCEGHVLDNVGNKLWLDGLNWPIGRGTNDVHQYDGVFEPMFPSGAACVFRRSLITALGGFDDAFFSYGEDADLGLRAFLRGFRCSLVPKAIAWHHLSYSLGQASEVKLRYIERNRILLAWKLFPTAILALSVPLSLLRYCGWLALSNENSRVFPLLQALGRFRLLSIAWTSHWEALRMIRSGSVRRAPPITSSLSFIALVRPYLLSVRELLWS